MGGTQSISVYTWESRPWEWLGSPRESEQNRERKTGHMPEEYQQLEGLQKSQR